MIDALIGAVIAVVATSALTLLAEVMTSAETTRQTSLTEYEKSVLCVVERAHGGSCTPASEQALLDWMRLARGDD